MTDQHEATIVRWPDQNPSAEAGLSVLLAGYHLRTEAERPGTVTDANGLLDRYRAEISDPRTAFADDIVLVALCGDTAAGCLVMTAPVGGRSEIKRLWTDPAFRSRGIASGLLAAALAHAAEIGVTALRVSVWERLSGAIVLYERFGFTVTEPWDERDQQVCMEHAV